jgi:uncharacterized protein
METQVLIFSDIRRGSEVPGNRNLHFIFKKQIKLRRRILEDLIRYDLLAQNAMRDVIRQAMYLAAREGLPGEHHYFITFKTYAAGVRVSHRTRESFPDDMTIVLQHQFWDLKVDDEGFSVGLSFRGVPEKLDIPYTAITEFFDPSVNFGLKFELAEDVQERQALAKSQEKSTETGAEKEAATPIASISEFKETPVTPQIFAPAAFKKEEPKNDEPLPEGGAQIVSLDNFRKKK